MSLWQDYHIARSTEDALRTLREAPKPVQIVSGGTDLLLDMRQGRHHPVHTLVDVNDIQEMRRLEVQDDELFIGASVPHRIITESPLVRHHARALAAASGLIGGPQVRNTATIGGNVAHALPAADGTIALIAMGARAEITSSSGIRQIPLQDLFAAPGKNTLNPTEEILTGFRLKLRSAGQGSAFNRIMRPQGVAIAILNLAVWLEMDGDAVADVRIAVGPAGPTPRRMTKAETILRGETLNPSSIDAAYRAALEDASLRTSKHRATREYRQDMLGVLLEKTLGEAAEKAAE